MRHSWHEQIDELLHPPPYHRWNVEVLINFDSGSTNSEHAARGIAAQGSPDQLLYVARTLLVPQVLLLAALHLVHYSPGVYLRVFLHIAAVPVFSVLQTWYTSLVSQRAAASLGAVPIPCVRGKWPGNLDIAYNLVRSMKRDYIMQYMADLFDEYGCETINTRILWSDQIITINELNIKFMLTGAGFEWFHKGYYWQERFERFLGNGIFNRDHGEWQTHRQIARPWFAKDRISDLDLFDRHASTTMTYMSTFSNVEEAFDVQDLFARFTLDTASEFLFGKCLNTLEGALPIAGKAKTGPKGSAIDDEFGTFAWAFEDVQVKISTRTRIGKMWPIFELFKDKTTESNAVVQDWIKPLVEKALEEKDEDSKLGGRKDEDKTFLSHLADSTNDTELIRFQVLNMLLAGRDTTAALLSFVVYLFCVHPDVMDELRHEIINEYGINVRAVLNETLRLFPSVPMNIRLSDDNPHAFPGSPSGDTPKYYIPPGTQILYNTLLVQRKHNLWGNDADHFKPSRWLDPEHIKKVTSNPFMFIPFHAGPRICLGQNFAYNEMSFFLIRLLQNFSRFELAGDAQPEDSKPPARWKNGKGRQAYEQVWPSNSVTSYIKGIDYE
ncbi:hypothetical protein EW146_g8151 [Bondarzewia mesenterica]|uniref:Cytochrome P450 n=1 Tax=Bondarzewia mesenterica TaxID=1095465 RepID=A0A4S4LGY3_9AGAM|nr:hypothetical protein EW146_g8151 [Bondarzewia mesenterica]